MKAIAAALDMAEDAQTQALLCQKAENLVAGAPCGVMDQMTCMCGEEDFLLVLLCRPAQLQRPVRVPNDIALWGVDSRASAMPLADRITPPCGRALSWDIA